MGGLGNYVASSAPAGAAAIETFHPSVSIAFVMLPVDFELADGSIVHWYMERFATIADVKVDMKTQTGADVGELFINHEALDDGKTYHEVIFLFVGM